MQDLLLENLQRLINGLKNYERQMKDSQKHEVQLDLLNNNERNFKKNSECASRRSRQEIRKFKDSIIYTKAGKHYLN